MIELLKRMGLCVLIVGFGWILIHGQDGFDKDSQEEAKEEKKMSDPNTMTLNEGQSLALLEFLLDRADDIRQGMEDFAILTPLLPLLEVQRSPRKET